MNEIILKSIETYYSKETMKINDIDCRVTFFDSEHSECECEFSLGVYAEKHDVKLFDMCFIINEKTGKYYAQIMYDELSEKLIGKEILEALSVYGDHCFLTTYDMNFIDANDVVNFEELNNIIYKALMCNEIELATDGGKTIYNIEQFVAELNDIFSFITVMEENRVGIKESEKRFLDYINNSSEEAEYSMNFGNIRCGFVKKVNVDKIKAKKIADFITKCTQVDEYWSQDEKYQQDMCNIPAEQDDFEIRKIRMQIFEEYSSGNISYAECEKQQISMNITKDMFIEMGMYLINKLISHSIHNFEIRISGQPIAYEYYFKILNENELQELADLIF